MDRYAARCGFGDGRPWLKIPLVDAWGSVNILENVV
jgi:hypothetical protein